jgi:hypothetical protein
LFGHLTAAAGFGAVKPLGPVSNFARLYIDCRVTKPCLFHVSNAWISIGHRLGLDLATAISLLPYLIAFRPVRPLSEAAVNVLVARRFCLTLSSFLQKTIASLTSELCMS